MIAVAMALAGPLAAGEVQDRLFSVGVLDEVPTGAHLVFAHTRAGSYDATQRPAIADGEVDVAIVEGERGRAAELTLTDGDKVASRLTLPAGAGSPILLLFLETSVRSMAAVTGGSPFYIHNRVREALANQDDLTPVEIEIGGKTVAGERLVLRPFESDRNRDRMGAFAELELSIVISDEVPGGFARFEATTGPGQDGQPVFNEAMIFERMEK